MSPDWETWRTARADAAFAPFGTASLDRTEWLTAEPMTLAGLPGRWRVADGAVVADGATPEPLRLHAGEEADLAGVRVRGFTRNGVGVRVFDPASAHRTTARGISAFAYDPAWRVTGRYRPAAETRVVDVVAVDGLVSSARVAGEIDFETPAGAATLTVTVSPTGGYSAVLSDATSGGETYRFRFVDLGSGPDGDRFTVDFNRLHLPPCAFSDQYVCPTPLPGNRWAIPVRAGERSVVRASLS